MPDEDLSFDDLVRGEITFPAGSFTDFVVVRPNGAPLYTFVNPVDDALMGVTHVLRGEDLLSSTPRQIALYRGAHRDRRRDRDPAVRAPALRDGRRQQEALEARPASRTSSSTASAGFIPEGLLNYLSLLGWSIAPDRDVFTRDELVAAFDVADVNPNPARFDLKKAESINGDHIRMLAADDFAARLVPYLGQVFGEPPTRRRSGRSSREAAPLVQERMQLLGEAAACSASCSSTPRTSRARRGCAWQAWATTRTRCSRRPAAHSPSSTTSTPRASSRRCATCSSTGSASSRASRSGRCGWP